MELLGREKRVVIIIVIIVAAFVLALFIDVYPSLSLPFVGNIRKLCRCYVSYYST